MFLSLFLTIAAACVFAEFTGYWLHVLLHSEKIPFLSRNHRLHHLVVYTRARRTESAQEAQASPYDRASRLFVGVECIFPVAVILALALTVMRFAGQPALLQAVFAATSASWGLIMFGYVHGAMHDRSSWMQRSAFCRERFMLARRLHDIHHLDMDASGRSGRNYGVFFFGFDKLFGTFTEKEPAFVREELKTAFKRYLEICSAAV